MQSNRRPVGNNTIYVLQSGVSMCLVMLIHVYMLKEKCAMLHVDQRWWEMRIIEAVNSSATETVGLLLFFLLS